MGSLQLIEFFLQYILKKQQFCGFMFIFNHSIGIECQYCVERLGTW
jgi:hypothetical protein